MIRIRPLPLLIALFALASCETAQGLKRDTHKLWQDLSAMAAPASSAPADDPADSLQHPLAADCPPVTIMPELKTLAEFTNPAKPGAATKISEFTLVGAQSDCTRHAAALAMKIDLIFTGKLGPKAKTNKADKPSFAYPYFIAVTNREGAILAKEIFAASVAYGADQTDIKQIETITQTIPIKDDESLTDYRVMVGLQLDEAQLAYNRAQDTPAP